ncbi:MAG: hypothetical protein F6K04_20180 [Leptolyngbya sp. SIO4C5]|uniref:hypothetical protein n=1 Tax=Sphaerothrix gracilis TaxID=3151835 RepID=UPI0013C0869B|nr:hypothetical protein [Leptolyngbya sp. SIO4C5]
MPVSDGYKFELPQLTPAQQALAAGLIDVFLALVLIPLLGAALLVMLEAWQML